MSGDVPVPHYYGLVHPSSMSASTILEQFFFFKGNITEIPYGIALSLEQLLKTRT